MEMALDSIYIGALDGEREKGQQRQHDTSLAPITLLGGIPSMRAHLLVTTLGFRFGFLNGMDDGGIYDLISQLMESTSALRSMSSSVRTTSSSEEIPCISASNATKLLHMCFNLG